MPISSEACTAPHAEAPCPDRPSNYVATPQLVEHMLDDPLGCRAHRRHPQFGRLGCLIGRVETGKVFELPGLGLGIKALGIAPDAFVERGVHKYLDKVG